MVCQTIYVGSGKNCPKCKRYLPYEAFGEERGKRKRIASHCRACKGQRSKVYHRTVEGRYADLTRSARSRGLDVSLTYIEYEAISTNNCHYCEGYFQMSPTGCGLDRVDSSKGYISDNVVRCCSTCNTLKGLLNYEGAKFAIKCFIAELKTKGITGLQFQAGIWPTRYSSGSVAQLVEQRTENPLPSVGTKTKAKRKR
jgi:hypothetical protein